MSVVTVERTGPVLLIGVNRPEAYNLWDLEVIREVSRAYRQLGDDAGLRVGIVFGHGRGFTAGLDLPAVAPAVATGDVAAVFPPDGYDPWDFFGEPCPKPIVVAAHGTCNTLGIELMLASPIAIASEGTKFRATGSRAWPLSARWGDISPSQPARHSGYALPAHGRAL